MSEEFLAQVVVSLGDGAVKSVFLLSIAWLLTRMVRRSAAARHLIWQTAFLILLLLPLLSCLMPSLGVAHVFTDASILQRSLRTRDAEAVRHSSAQDLSRASETPSVLLKSPRHAEPVNPSSSPRDLRPDLLRGALVLWLCGVVFVLLRAMLAYLAVTGLLRRSMRGTPLKVDLATISARAGVRRSWELRTSLHARPSSAITWGFFRPVVLLPHSSVQWSERWLEAVLLHELAHVRRRDSASQLLIEAVCALYWCNPLIWICARAMRAEAERAADDLVLHCGFTPSVYAAELLKAAAAQVGRRPHILAGYGLSIINDSPIEARIRSIVEPHHHRRGANTTEGTAAITVALVALLLFAPYRSVGLASPTGNPVPSSNLAMISQKDLAGHAGGPDNNLQTQPAQPSPDAAQKGRAEAADLKGTNPAARVVESQTDFREQRELPATGRSSADLSTSEPAPSISDGKSGPGQSPDLISHSADHGGRREAFGPDVVGKLPQESAVTPHNVDQVKTGRGGQRDSSRSSADLLSVEPTLRAEKERPRQQRHEAGSADLWSDGTDPTPALPGRHEPKPRAPDVTLTLP